LVWSRSKMKKSSTTTSKTKRVWYMESWNHEFITSSCVSLTLISGHTVHHQVSTHLEIVRQIFHLHKLATTIKQLLARGSSNSLYLLVLVQHQYSKKGGWWKTQKMHHSLPTLISWSCAEVLSSFFCPAFFSTVKLYPVGWLGPCDLSKDLSHSCLLVRSDGI
jgi:hypothetical protein